MRGEEVKSVLNNDERSVIDKDRRRRLDMMETWDASVVHENDRSIRRPQQPRMSTVDRDVMVLHNRLILRETSRSRRQACEL